MGQTGEGIYAITPPGRVQPNRTWVFDFRVCVVLLSPGFSRQHFALLCHPPLPQTGVPSWHLGRKVELTSHEACYVSILPSEKELGRIPGKCGGPEITKVFQAGESGQQCPRRRSSAEKEKEFGGPKRLEGPCLSNCGKRKYKFT